MRKAYSCKRKLTTLLRGSPSGRIWLLFPRPKAILVPSCRSYTARFREVPSYVAAARRAKKSDQGCGHRAGCGALLDSRNHAHARRYFSEPEPSGHLCSATVRRNVASANGRIPRLLLRISFPIHHRDRVRRIQIHSKRRIAETGISSWHRHEPGHGSNRWLCGPRSRVYAAWNSVAVHHALRCGERSGWLPGFFQRDPKRRRKPGCCTKPSPTFVRHAARSLGAAAVRRSGTNHRGQRRSGPPARLSHGTG